MRVQIKAPLSGHAERLAIAELARLVKEGENPRAVVEQTIYHCWKSFYKVKPPGRAAPGALHGDDPTGDKAAAAEHRRTQKYLYNLVHG